MASSQICNGIGSVGVSCGGSFVSGGFVNRTTQPCAFDARHIVDEMAGSFGGSLTALVQQNEMSSTVKRRESQSVNPTTFLKLADNLAHKNQHPQTGDAEGDGGGNAIVLGSSCEQVLAH